MKMFRLLNFDVGMFGIIWLASITFMSFLFTEISIYLTAALVAIFMCVVGPDRKRYLHLGLDSALWRRHRLIALWLHALVFSAAALVGGLVTEPAWIVVVAPLAIALIRSMRIPQENEQPRRSHGSMRKAHLRLWRDIWAGNIMAVICVWAISVWKGEEFDPIPVIGFTVFLFVALFLGSSGVLRVSLRQWIALGGTRGEWFTKAVRLASVNLLGAAAMYVLMTIMSVDSGTQLLVASLFLPLIVLAMNLASRRTVWLPVLGSAFGFLACAPVGWLYIPVTVVGVFIMLWGIRKTILEAQVFNPGFAGWLGITGRAV